MKVKAFGTDSQTNPLKEMEIERRDLNSDDILLDILYSGVCHSDIHTVRNEWGNSTVYPVVPGHEIVGRITKIGNSVSKYKVGDLVGVGCFVDSCGVCDACEHDLEQYCENGFTATYNSPDKYIKDQQTYGGYSKSIVTKEHFVLKVSEKLDTKAVAPLLCAGITTYSPLRHWNVKKGDKVGVVGLGGLGHMGVKFAAAMGADVVVISRSVGKKDDALKLGANRVLISTDADAMAKEANSFDFILNTIPHPHDVNPYMGLLKRDATMCLVGAIEPLKDVHGGSMIYGRKNLAGSLVGGIAETQEMLDFCAEHNIVCDVEMIEMKDINKAYDRVVASDVKYRFVIDMNKF